MAKFKRVYKIAFSDANVGKPVEKLGYIDLMNIQDPAGAQAAERRRADLPFFTIENVDVVDANHIAGNDNNFPFQPPAQYGG